MAATSAQMSPKDHPPGPFLTEAWMGGVRVRLQSDRPLGLRGGGLPIHPSVTEPVVAELFCRATAQERGEAEETACTAADYRALKTVRWERRGRRTRATTSHYSVDIERLADGRYDAVAEFSADDSEQLLEMLVHSVLALEGGVYLHAAGAELDGRVYLFVGPSGAGKSTAVSLLEQARTFAVDRAALFQVADGWCVSPMPGGEVPAFASPFAESRCLPLAGIFSVVQSEGAPRVATLGAAQQFAVLRAAAVWSGGVNAEGALLDRLLALAGAVPVAEVHTVLGSPLEAVLRDWRGGTP